MAGSVVPTVTIDICGALDGPGVNTRLTEFCRSGTSAPRWFPERQRPAGMKREYGEEEPIGAESVTAPATVSGKRPVRTTGHSAREGTASEDPRSQETCHLDVTQPGRGAWTEARYGYDSIC